MRKTQMNKIKSFLFAFFLLVIAVSAQVPNSFSNLHSGINLSEWLEKNNNLEAKASILTTETIDSLKEMGFDHVRIPISEEILFDEALNTRLQILDLLKSRIDHCQKIGLKVIIDLHGARLFSFTKSGSGLFNEPQPIGTFLKVWKKLQEIFRSYPTDFLAYECLNEPATAKDKHHLWNNVLNEWISFIRKTEQNRVLFVGTNRGNQLWTLKFLKLPQDKHLVITIHYYYPFLFTHYHPNEAKASNFSGKVHYPGKTIDDEDFRNLPETLKKEYSQYRDVYDKKRIYADFKPAFDFSKKHGIPLNIGEFGCRRFSAPEDRLQWFKDVTSILKENNASYTLWGLGGSGFGIKINGQLDQPMLDAIR